MSQVPRTLQSLPGLLVMVSTAETTRRSAELDAEYEASRTVTGWPAWVFFDVWDFPNLALFNFQIAASPGGTRLGSVYQVECWRGPWYSGSASVADAVFFARY